MVWKGIKAAVCNCSCPSAEHTEGLLSFYKCKIQTNLKRRTVYRNAGPEMTIKCEMLNWNEFGFKFCLRIIILSQSNIS